MSDLIDPIVIPIDSTSIDKMIKSTIAAEAMFKRLTKAFEEGVISSEEVNRGLEEIATHLDMTSVATRDAIALQKQAAAVEKETAAIKAAAIKDLGAKADTAFALSMQRYKEEQKEQDDWFSSQKRRLSMMQESEKLEAKRLADEKRVSDTLIKNRQAEIQAQIAADAETAKAAKQEADMLDYLNTKYDKSYAATKLYKAAQNEINLAMSKGAGNADTLKAELAKLEAEYIAFNNGSATTSNRFAQQTKAIDSTRSSFSGMGFVMQQTGYQVGDFLVQIQSGANVVMAFGQQMTQLIYVLPELAKEFAITEVPLLGMSVGIGALTAGLGIAIPLLTAIVGAFLRSGKGAKDAGGDLEDYTKIVKELTAEIQKNQEAFLKAKFGANPAVGEARKQMADLEQQIKDLNKTISENPPESFGAAAMFALAGEAVKKQLADLQTQLQVLQDQDEATRKLTDQARIKAAFELQHLQDLKDQQSVLEGSDVKANLLKNTFHAMAGETGAVSVSLNGWAGEIIAASDAASALSQYMYKVNNMANMSGRGLPANGMPANVMHDYGMESPGIDTNKLFKNIDFGPGGASIKPKKDKGLGGAAGSGGGAETSLKDIYKYLEDSKKLNEYATKEEDTAYDQRQKALKSALSKRIISLKEYQATELDLTRKHEVALQTIENQGRVAKLSTVLGTGAQILTALGEHNAKAAKMAKVLGAAQALADTYAGAAAALKLPFPANLAAAGSIISAGLGFVASIQSGSSGGKPSATIPSTSTATAAAAQTATPQQVLIQGIKPTDIFTGEQLSQLFDSLYKENRARGMVFQVQR